jgi:hypothetical protein
MSASGQKRTLGQLRVMSALPSKADIAERRRHRSRAIRPWRAGLGVGRFGLWGPLGIS